MSEDIDSAIASIRTESMEQMSALQATAAAAQSAAAEALAQAATATAALESMKAEQTGEKQNERAQEVRQTSAATVGETQQTAGKQTPDRTLELMASMQELEHAVMEAIVEMNVIDVTKITGVDELGAL